MRVLLWGSLLRLLLGGQAPSLGLLAHCLPVPPLLPVRPPVLVLHDDPLGFHAVTSSHLPPFRASGDLVGHLLTTKGFDEEISRLAQTLLGDEQPVYRYPGWCGRASCSKPLQRGTCVATCQSPAVHNGCLLVRNLEKRLDSQHGTDEESNLANLECWKSAEDNVGLAHLHRT